MSDFKKQWVSGNKVSLADKFRNSLFPGKIKPKVDNMMRILDLHSSKLKMTRDKFQKKEAIIFNQIVECNSRRDTLTANVLANELAQMRKITAMISYYYVIVEKSLLRIETVNDMGDLTVALSPMFKTVKKMKGSLSNIVPEANAELNQLGDLMGEIVDEDRLTADEPAKFEVKDELAEQILSEASLVADQNNSLPSLDTVESEIPSISSVTAPHVKKVDEDEDSDDDVSGLSNLFGE